MLKISCEVLELLDVRWISKDIVRVNSLQMRTILHETLLQGFKIGLESSLDTIIVH